MGFMEDIQKTALCGDGSIRAALRNRKVDFPESLEALCLGDPDLIADIHGEYLAAGARVIRTNSRHANALRFGNRINEINWQAAQIAKQAAKGTGAYVAGCVGPLNVAAEDSVRQAILQEQIGALLDGGSNLILFEGFSDVGELLLALYIKQSLHHCPAVCLLAGADADAFSRLQDAGAEVVGIHHAPAGGALLHSEDVSLAVYLEKAAISSETVAGLASRGVSLIGGGADAAPEDVRRIAETLRKREEE